MKINVQYLKISKYQINWYLTFIKKISLVSFHNNKILIKASLIFLLLDMVAIKHYKDSKYQ